MRDPLVQRCATGVEHLQIVAPAVAGAAEQECAALGMGEERLKRVAAHVGRERDGIGLVALEGLARVVLGRGADVASLRIEYDRDGRMCAADVLHQSLELRLGAR